MIVNKLDGRTYVGKRKSSKKWFEDKYMGSGCHLKNSQKKYGIENFEKFLIEYTYSEEDACKKEVFWIAEYRKRGKAEYNFDDGGRPSSHNKGKKFSTYVRQNMSKAKKGKPTPWLHTSEVIQKISESHKGQVPWNKSKRGVQEAWNKGLTTGPLPDNVRQKMSNSHKGKQWPDKDKSLAKRNQTLKDIGFHSNKGMKWKLIDGKRFYYKEEE